MKIEHLIVDDTVFHCDTPEKATEFINKAHELGYKWSCANKNTTFYECYRENICYTLNKKETKIGYSGIDYFKSNNYTIIEYELDTVNNKKLTPVEYLMEYLDVEENEKFNILELNGNGRNSNFNPFHFSYGNLIDNYSAIRNDALIELINGTLIVEKLPWKPSVDDTVWFIGEDRYIYSTIYCGVAPDLAMMKNGWYFSTKEEAEVNKERILVEYAEVMSNE